MRSTCSVDDASLALAAIELLLPHAVLEPGCAEVGSKMPSHNPTTLLQMAVRATIELQHTTSLYGPSRK